MFNLEHLGEVKGVIGYSYYRFQVTLTNDAKKYLLKQRAIKSEYPDTSYIGSFITSKTYFEGIKTIHEMPSLNGADVYYTVKVSDFTPFWNYYKDRSRKRIDTFATRVFGMLKTNDGWRPANLEK